ncbi:MAG TPA: sensor histidine kinase, partial [Aquaticitalea sp.]|nr:sensor histidine kinase [Aquaticitalea sp.]
MDFKMDRNVLRWLLVLASFIIISLILWNTYIFFQNFKSEERTKMQNWSLAQEELNRNIDLDADIGELIPEVISSNTTTPMILVNDDGSINHNNIDEEKAKDPQYIQKLIKQFSNENKP